MREAASAYFRSLQDRLCQALEGLDGTGRFREDAWRREGGGGGRSRVLADGAVFEKAGVNFSEVFGQMSPEFAKQVPGEGLDFTATGISLVLHPRSPMVPTVHANFRFLTKGERQWFGGGSDLTPYYPYREDVVHFHRVWKGVCDRHAPVADYPRFKKWCDEYFFSRIGGRRAGSAVSFSITWRGIERRPMLSSAIAAIRFWKPTCRSLGDARMNRSRRPNGPFKNFAEADMWNSTCFT